MSLKKLGFPISLPTWVKTDRFGAPIKLGEIFFLAMPFYEYKPLSGSPGPDNFRVASPPAGISTDEKLKWLKPDATGFITFGAASDLILKNDHYGTGYVTSSPAGVLSFSAEVTDHAKWDLFSLEYPDDDRPLCFGDLIVLRSKASAKLLSATDASTPIANAAAAGYEEIWMVASP